ncbi:hypothetical protein Dda_9422 [Drechslerella dactyloides]|uniref:Tyrosine specific protein phosphatases domain-containing protein n=1 Tax=Drechslerella dactyloides TaxID=74499 RepID=A0AAD6IPG9_DREDA|nr:hypothetical protein Dda_9422 [Drechslerella dactyloides]
MGTNSICQIYAQKDMRRVLKEGILFRSGRLDHATEADLQFLVSKSRLRSVIDLRTKTELGLVPTKKGIASLTDFPNTTVYHIPYLNDEYTNKALLAKLPWYRVLQLLIYHLLGLRMAIIIVISTYAIVPLGLKGIARECLRYLRPEIRQTFEILSDGSKYPTLLHCTQGKDRTGLATVLILLAVLGDGEDMVRAMDYDYMLSNEGLKLVRDEMLKEMVPLGYTEESGFTDAEKGWVEAVVGFVQEAGGIATYLADIGIGEQELRQIRENLLVNPPLQSNM